MESCTCYHIAWDGNLMMGKFKARSRAIAYPKGGWWCTAVQGQVLRYVRILRTGDCEGICRQFFPRKACLVKSKWAEVVDQRLEAPAHGCCPRSYRPVREKQVTKY